jgi:hypothetical protein
MDVNQFFYNHGHHVVGGTAIALGLAWAVGSRIGPSSLNSDSNSIVGPLGPRVETIWVRTYPKSLPSGLELLYGLPIDTPAPLDPHGTFYAFERDIDRDRCVANRPGDYELSPHTAPFQNLAYGISLSPDTCTPDSLHNFERLGFRFTTPSPSSQRSWAFTLAASAYNTVKQCCSSTVGLFTVARLLRIIFMYAVSLSIYLVAKVAKLAYKHVVNNDKKHANMAAVIEKLEAKITDLEYRLQKATSGDNTMYNISEQISKRMTELENTTAGTQDRLNAVADTVNGHVQTHDRVLKWSNVTDNEVQKIYNILNDHERKFGEINTRRAYIAQHLRARQSKHYVSHNAFMQMTSNLAADDAESYLVSYVRAVDVELEQKTAAIGGAYAEIGSVMGRMGMR